MERSTIKIRFFRTFEMAPRKVIKANDRVKGVAASCKGLIGLVVEVTIVEGKTKYKIRWDNGVENIYFINSIELLLPRPGQEVAPAGPGGALGPEIDGGRVEGNVAGGDVGRGGEPEGSDDEGSESDSNGRYACIFQYRSEYHVMLTYFKSPQQFPNAVKPRPKTISPSKMKPLHWPSWRQKMFQATLLFRLLRQLQQ
jgi:hypothetical protein